MKFSFSKKPFLKIKNILFGIDSHNTLHHEDFTPFLINANAYGRQNIEGIFIQTALCLNRENHFNQYNPLGKSCPPNEDNI